MIGDAEKTSRPRRRGRPREEHFLEREHELLESALELFLHQGYRGTTITQIMSAAHVSKRTLYQHYPDKAALFKAALEYGIAELAISRETLAAVESDDLEQSLQRIAAILVRNLMTATGIRLITITNSAAYSVPEIAEYAYRKGSEEINSFISELLRRHVPGCSREKAERAARAFQTLVIGGLARMRAWGVEYDDASIERLTLLRARLFVKGILKV